MNLEAYRTTWRSYLDSSSGQHVQTFAFPSITPGVPLHSVELYSRPGPVYFYVTNGIATAAQPGGTVDRNNERVELSATARQRRPEIAAILSACGHLLHLHGPTSGVLHVYDRMRLEEPVGGLERFLLSFSAIHDAISDGQVPPITLLGLIPISEDEGEFIARLGADGWLKSNRYFAGPLADEVYKRWSSDSSSHI